MLREIPEWLFKEIDDGLDLINVNVLRLMRDFNCRVYIDVIKDQTEDIPRVAISIMQKVR